MNKNNWRYEIPSNLLLGIYCLIDVVTAIRKVATLQSGKEQLEQYVAQLAEDMEKETSQMVSMKEQFQTHFTDYSAYIEEEDGEDVEEALEDKGEETNEEGDRGAERENGIGSTRSLSPGVSPIAARAKEMDRAKMRERGRSFDFSENRTQHSYSADHLPVLESSSEMYRSFELEHDLEEQEEAIRSYREEIVQLREELRRVKEAMAQSQSIQVFTQEHDQNNTHQSAADVCVVEEDESRRERGQSQSERDRGQTEKRAEQRGGRRNKWVELAFLVLSGYSI